MFIWTGWWTDMFMSNDGTQCPASCCCISYNCKMKCIESWLVCVPNTYFEVKTGTSIKYQMQALPCHWLRLRPPTPSKPSPLKSVRVMGRVEPSTICSALAKMQTRRFSPLVVNNASWFSDGTDSHYCNLLWPRPALSPMTEASGSDVWSIMQKPPQTPLLVVSFRKGPSN